MSERRAKFLSPSWLSLLFVLYGCATPQKALDERCMRVELDSVGVRDYVRAGVSGVSWYNGARRTALYIDLVVPPEFGSDLTDMTLMAGVHPASEPRCTATGEPGEGQVDCAQSIPGTGRVLLAKFRGTRTDEYAARMALLIRYVRESVLCE
jgi:hypothetical protein